ncbi:MAG: SfnB family sulfur acquisition oxidoreductase [Dongiaceae bacterium]
MSVSQAASGVVRADSPRKPEAHVIRSDAEAIEVAHRVAAELAPGAAQRDRDRILPHREIELFSQSGLWAINVPKAYGGAEVSYATVARVVQIVSAADPSIGQIPQNHLDAIDTIRTTGNDAQKLALFSAILKGARTGNAYSEFGSRTAADFQTRIRPSGENFIVKGRKFYSTGALFADLIPITALDEAGRSFIAIADRHAPGLTIVDDWSSFGQRTTASGTVIIDNVEIPASHVLPTYVTETAPSANGAVCQIVHAAVDAGIAVAAIEDTRAFVRGNARPWIDSGQARAADDPYTIAAVGELQLRLHAAEALLARAGRILDAAIAEATPQTVAAASIAVAEAKVLTTEIAIQATNRLFELAGTRSTLAQHGLDRHWRNARVHTLHDPVRWKYHAIGNYYLNEVRPPRHSWI